MNKFDAMSYNECLSYIQTLTPSEIDLGLDRISVVYRKLCLQPLAKKVVLVGGTNGKGSTCAFLESIFLNLDKKVAVYSSPHLVDFNERLRINGKNITNDCMIRAFKIIESHRADVPLSFFEFTTLSAFLIMSELDLDYAFVEVGLGGRLDATNILDSDLSIITNVSLDHTDWLGNTIEQIAFEKAGIIKEKSPVILGDPLLPNIINERAKALGCDIYQAERDFHGKLININQFEWETQDRKIFFRELPKLHLENANSAIMASIVLAPQLQNKDIIRGILKAQLPGRFQLLRKNPDVILDVAHNHKSASLLARNISKYKKNGKIYALVGMLKDKDIESVINEINPHVDFWLPVSLNYVDRGASKQEISKFLPSNKMVNITLNDGNIFHNYTELTQMCKPEDLIICFGSFFTVGDILRSF